MIEASIASFVILIFLRQFYRKKSTPLISSLILIVLLILKDLMWIPISDALGVFVSFKNTYMIGIFGAQSIPASDLFRADTSSILTYLAQTIFVTFLGLKLTEFYDKLSAKQIP